MKTYRVRVQSFVRTRDVVGYVTLLVALFVTVTLVINAEWSDPQTYGQWWYLGIPWVLLTLGAWVPTFQMVYYRQTFLTVEFEEVKQTCRVVDSAFAGEWRIKKNYPRRMTTAQTATIIFSFFLILMLILQIMALYHVWHTPSLQSSTLSKVNAIQGLCLPLILASPLVRMWSFWKYPNSIVLRQPGKWLSAQFRDDV